jgi:hypothetical protein
LTGVKVHFLPHFQPCVTVFLWLLELELTELLSCRIPHNGSNLPLPPVFRQPSSTFRVYENYAQKLRRFGHAFLSRVHRELLRLLNPSLTHPSEL